MEAQARRAQSFEGTNGLVLAKATKTEDGETLDVSTDDAPRVTSFMGPRVRLFFATAFASAIDKYKGVIWLRDDQLELKFTQLAYVLLSKVRGKDIEFKSGTLDFERITSYELFSVLRFALENVPHMQEVYKTVMADLAAQERASIAGPDDGGGVLAVKKTGDQACPLPPRLEIVDQTTFMLFGIANFARTRFDFEALSNSIQPSTRSSRAARMSLKNWTRWCSKRSAGDWQN